MAAHSLDHADGALVRAGRRSPRHLPVEPAPYFFEAGQEYTLREFRELLVEPARNALRSNEINRAF
ncbi:MAG: hypothetical protein M3169_18195, partial [Candidatus Eremiobacteraeota bacterium]|nr:hypothetical protein [Candidatus Eremiobacteraeota bacterium]